MQKHNIFQFVASLALSLGALCASNLSAQEAAPTQELTAQLSPVGAGLKNIKFDYGTPNLKAEYYIYMQSAWWCGSCHKKMPAVVKAYKDMKADGRVELIFISSDKTPEDYANFVSRYKMEFPCVMKGAPGTDELPGFTRQGLLPAALIVDAQGNVLGKGSDLIPEWKKHTIERETK